MKKEKGKPGCKLNIIVGLWVLCCHSILQLSSIRLLLLLVISFRRIFSATFRHSRTESTTCNHLLILRHVWWRTFSKSTCCEHVSLFRWFAHTEITAIVHLNPIFMLLVMPTLSYLACGLIHPLKWNCLLYLPCIAPKKTLLLLLLVLRFLNIYMAKFYYNFIFVLLTTRTTICINTTAQYDEQRGDS